MTAAEQLATLQERWPDEWRNGARCAFLRSFDGERESGGYPRGFHAWPLDRRNAWFAGFSMGFHDRLNLTREVAR
jgi:hypothetical protein